MKDTKEFPILKTKRLVLRALEAEDVEAIYKIFSSEEVTAYYGMYPLSEPVKARQMIEAFAKSFEEDRGIRWAITVKDTGEVIGTCGFMNSSSRHRRTEVGYELHEDAWHKGYAKEALRAIIAYGFETMQWERIEALVYPENTTSNCLLLTLGFELEGLLRGHAYFREKQQDLNMFSLLKSMR
ncbi:MAG: GNAT family N-acetyltransferase [Cellulosilyticaceae bacterium]